MCLEESNEAEEGMSCEELLRALSLSCSEKRRLGDDLIALSSFLRESGERGTELLSLGSSDCVGMVENCTGGGSMGHYKAFLY